MSLRSELHRFGLERDRLRAAVAREAGLALSDLDALEHLEADGPLTQRELGRRLLLTSGAITMLVDRLEDAGLVERSAHPTDRRAVHVALAAGAFERMPPALHRYHRAIAAAARRVPQRERDRLESFLTAARAAAERAVDELV